MSTTKSSPAALLLYRFGPYEVDTAHSELRKFGIRIRLERKPWQLLIALLERAGQVVTRSELQHSLWGEDVFVDFDTGLNVAVRKLRGALCDSTRGSTYIETVEGKGYRFVAPVEKVFTIANASTSVFPQLKPAALGRPSPVASSLQSPAQDVPFIPIIHTELNSGPTEGCPVAEVTLVQPERGAEPQFPAQFRRSRLRKREARSAVAVVVCVVLLAIAIGQLTRRTVQHPDTPHAAKIMVVVLPFENLSGDPGQEYLSDGMTEELSERLGNLNPQLLGVIGRTSAMTYKHSPRTITQIGKELGVAYVVEGSVRRDRNKLRVTAQLLDVSDQAHIWSQNYDRDLHGLLRIEDEVASEIARQVGVTMALGPPQEALHRHVPNVEAHEAYLIARYYWNKRTPEGWAKAGQYFRRAVEKDPEFAAAYAGLAVCGARQEALAAARKAVELDSNSGETRTALAWVEYFREWDFVAAEDALRTAIQLDPNYAPAHHLYSGVLALAGRLQESIDEEKQAVVLDPLALIFRAALALGLSLAGKNAEAMERINQIFAIDPHYPKAHETLGTIYLRRGMYKEAIYEFKASERYGGAKELAPVGYAYARLGEKQTALRILSELQALEKSAPSADLSGDLALVEIGLGHRDAALAWLEKEYEQHDDDGPWDTKRDPLFEPLHSDPRFQELMRRVKFPG